MGNYLNMHVCIQSIKLKHSSPWQVLLLFHWICIDTPQFIHLQVNTCLLLCDFPVCEEGLFLYVWVWPCHMCAGSRRIPRFRAGIVSVSPRWHADIYRNADVFVLLSSPWQRAHRSPRIPAQYQFAQADRSKCMQGVHTTAHRAVE